MTPAWSAQEQIRGQEEAQQAKQAEPQQAKQAEPQQAKQAEPQTAKQAEPQTAKQAEPQQAKQAEPQQAQALAAFYLICMNGWGQAVRCAACRKIEEPDVRQEPQALPPASDFLSEAHRAFLQNHRPMQQQVFAANELPD
jgi:hypothetical protein